MIEATESTRLDELVEKLREHGYRLTPQRKEVMTILATSQDHLNVEEIYTRVCRKFPTTSLATIYNTVAVLKDMGEVLEISFGSSGNRYDGNKPVPHPHLICENCESVIDPAIPALEELTQQVSELTGYQVTSHRFDFFGICPDCQR